MAEAPLKLGLMWWRNHVPDLDAILNVTSIRQPWLNRAKLDAVAGWGRHPSYEKAARYAAKHNIPVWSLEDGFLRSLGLGKNGDPPLSLVADNCGIYYDASRPSQLEHLIAAPPPDLTQAQQAIQLLHHHKLSKYNHAPDSLPPLPHASRYVLIIDQSFGDSSVQYGGATAATFSTMLADASRENPDSHLLIKTHPDAINGHRRSWLNAPLPPNTTLITQDTTPHALFALTNKIYTVSSHMGFEALLCGKSVICYGWPWYAGWGCTEDRGQNFHNIRQRRTAQRSPTELFAAAYHSYARYLDPTTGQAGTLFDVIDWLAEQKRRLNQRQGTLYCANMSLWKYAIVKPFLRGPGVTIKRLPSTKTPLPPDARLIIWGQPKTQSPTSIPISRLEDGFLRSVGLGSDLTRPLSLALDHSGVYYDPRSASDLETYLQTASFTPQNLERAARLRHRIIALGLSKYNVGTKFSLPATATGKQIILVAGQVADDASITLGTTAIADNLSLLRAVRAARPQAFIIYKPHPDVVAGNRQGQIDAVNLCDHIETNATSIACLSAADEIHTMTSLLGFEALLRGKQVHCYGHPFYAGWSLTHDATPIPRRTRRLTLDQLIYGTLIAYPLYLSPLTHRPIPVEQALTFLESPNTPPPSPNFLPRQSRKAAALLETFILSLLHR